MVSGIKFGAGFTASTQSIPAGDGVIEEQHDDGADDGHEHGIEIEARDAGAADLGENESADKRAHQTQRNVDEATFALVVDDPARNEARDQPEYGPTQNRHYFLHCFAGVFLKHNVIPGERCDRGAREGDPGVEMIPVFNL
jgi:hypothetical protein